MHNPNMLYIQCENCENIIPTGIAVSRDSKGTVLKNNIIRCPYCEYLNTWDGEDAFYIDKVPFVSE